MTFEKRLRELEGWLSSDPLTLCFADGATRQIRGRGNFLLDLLVGACRADLSQGQAQSLAWIRQSVSEEQAGGGHMIELLRMCPDGRPE